MTEYIVINKSDHTNWKLKLQNEDDYSCGHFMDINFEEVIKTIRENCPHELIFLGVEL